MKTALALALTMGLAAAFASCGDDDQDTGPQTATIRVTDEGYRPERLRVEAGDRVRFVNGTGVPLAVGDPTGDIELEPDAPRRRRVTRASDDGFATQQVPARGSATVAFRTPAVYRFRTTAHPVTTGVIEVVTPAAAAERMTTALHITRDFGRDTIWAREDVPLHGNETLLRQLRDEHSVVDDDGRLVKAIDGLRADWDGAEPTSWVTNVNGIETDISPVEYDIHAGDVVQWDLRDWYVGLSVRATVGAFPQTFTRGVFGRRFPVRVVCSQPGSDPCLRVRRTLRDAGVRIDGRLERGASKPPPGNPRRATVLVGPWRDLRDRRWPRFVDSGPDDSGIFASFSRDASRLRLHDWNGDYVRSAGPGTGLVAAMRPTEEDLLWMVTGVDDTGVERAADNLRSGPLRDAFAVAITASGVEKVPLPACAASPASASCTESSASR